MSALLVLAGVLVVLGLYAISLYNSLVTGQVQTKEAWSTVETQLKRRYDLVPNLVETVKGYAKHESKTLENLVNARNMAMSLNYCMYNSQPDNQAIVYGTESVILETLKNIKEQHENMLTGALKSVFALAENYPDLKANQNFLDLQNKLTDTEDKIQAARQYYNTAVMSLNRKIRIFPSNLIASRFGIAQEHFFELESSEKEAMKNAPKVQF